MKLNKAAFNLLEDKSTCLFIFLLTGGGETTPCNPSRQLIKMEEDVQQPQQVAFLEPSELGTRE